MKYSSFKTPTYEEYIAKLEKKREKDKERKKSQAAVKGQERTKQQRKEDDKLEEEWRTEVLKRDGYKCQYPKCRVSHKSLHAHHVAPRSQRPDLKYVVSNGKALCFAHHEAVHKFPLKSQEMGLLSNRSMELARKEGTLGQF